MKRTVVLSMAALALLAGCGRESPTEASNGAPVLSELVITQGVVAPAKARATRPSLSSAAAAVTSTLGGSIATAVSLKPQSCEPGGQQVVVTYTVSGRQDNPASFKVNTRWEYNGSGWAGSLPTAVNVATRGTGPGSDTYPVTLTLVNASATDAGSSSFSVVQFDLVTTAPAALGLGTGANVTVHVAFVSCPITNTAPSLTLPNDFTVEATSSAGAVVDFAAMITATDAQDGDLSSSVTCTPASGTTFAIGTTTVNCSVTDAGGLSASGSFDVTVVDTTPPIFTSFPSGTVNLIAADITGAVLDIDALGIAVEDVGHVSEPSTFHCDYVADTKLGIGTTTTVSCTAKDASNNESAPSTFDVFVGLNINATGFLPPLRMVAPFSAHKRGSTIPHKFLPPTYADGTPAVDLADGLRLVINHLDGTVEGADVEVNDFSAGSTTWRYDSDGGQYIFNLKTGTTTPWDVGTWKTTVSYAGIPLATTQFDLRR